MVLLIGGCAQRPNLPPYSGPDTAGAPTDFPAARYGGDQVYRVLASTLTIKVYRGGRLKRLGHNHVITSDALQGLLAAAPGGGLTGSFADLYVLAASFRVDEPADRAAAGDDFTSEPSASDRAGTRANMLGPKVLDAEQHPFLRAGVTLVTPDQALVDFWVRDHRYQQQIPVVARLEPGSATFSARFTATHAQLGLTPFSVLGGAIAVADPIEIDLQLTAVPQGVDGAP